MSSVIPRAAPFLSFRIPCHFIPGSLCKRGFPFCLILTSVLIYSASRSLQVFPMGMILSFWFPLYISQLRLTSSSFIWISSLTRIPVAYRSSSIALSRTPLAVLTSGSSGILVPPERKGHLLFHFRRFQILSHPPSDSPAFSDTENALICSVL